MCGFRRRRRRAGCSGELADDGRDECVASSSESNRGVFRRTCGGDAMTVSSPPPIVSSAATPPSLDRRRDVLRCPGAGREGPAVVVASSVDVAGDPASRPPSSRSRLAASSTSAACVRSDDELDACDDAGEDSTDVEAAPGSRTAIRWRAGRDRPLNVDRDPGVALMERGRVVVSAVSAGVGPRSAR